MARVKVARSQKMQKASYTHPSHIRHAFARTLHGSGAFIHLKCLCRNLTQAETCFPAQRLWDKTTSGPLEVDWSARCAEGGICIACGSILTCIVLARFVRKGCGVDDWSIRKADLIVLRHDQVYASAIVWAGKNSTWTNDSSGCVRLPALKPKGRKLSLWCGP